MTKHSDETRANALQLLANPELSYPNIRDATGVPVGTLAGWAKQAGIERSEAAKKTEAATEARKIRNAARREKLADDLLKYAADIFKRSHSIALDNEEVIDDKGKRTGLFLARARDAKDLMTTGAIALDKFRLEMGEATTVNEVRDSRPSEKVKGKLDELADRRKIRSA